MRNKRIVILDLDGTVFRSVRWSIEIFCNMLSVHGVTVTPELRREVARRWGAKTQTVKDRLFTHLPDETINRFYWMINSTIEIVPFIGMRQALETMQGRGLDLYVLSARGRVGAYRMLGRFGLRDLFTRVICMPDVGLGNAKPSPRGLEMILAPLEKTFGVSRDEAVFVGDGIHADMLCAQNAGVEFVAAHEEDVITRADWIEAGVAESNIIRSVRDLPAWLGIT